MLYGAYIYRYDIGDGKIFYCHSIQILSAEYPYSTGRISIFCWQNIHILPAESQYSARRIWIFCRQNRNNQEQLHWAQKACTPWAELGTAQPPLVFFCFLLNIPKVISALLGFWDTTQFLLAKYQDSAKIWFCRHTVTILLAKYPDAASRSELQPQKCRCICKKIYYMRWHNIPPAEYPHHAGRIELQPQKFRCIYIKI